MFWFKNCTQVILIKYLLKRGNEVIYVGITNNPERRTTLDGAKQLEADRIETYMRNHGGKTPKYNKNRSRLIVTLRLPNCLF